MPEVVANPAPRVDSQPDSSQSGNNPTEGVNTRIPLSQMPDLAQKTLHGLADFGKSLLKYTVFPTVMAGVYAVTRIANPANIVDDLKLIGNKIASGCRSFIEQHKSEMQDLRLRDYVSGVEESGLSPEQKGKLLTTMKSFLGSLNEQAKDAAAGASSEQDRKKITSDYSSCKDKVLSAGAEVVEALKTISASSLSEDQKTFLVKQVLELREAGIQGINKQRTELEVGGNWGGLTSEAELQTEAANFAKTLKEMTSHAVKISKAAGARADIDVDKVSNEMISSSFVALGDYCKTGRMAECGTAEYREMLLQYAKTGREIVASLGHTLNAIDDSKLEQSSQDTLRQKVLDLVQGGGAWLREEMDRKVKTGEWEGLSSLRPLLDSASQYTKFIGEVAAVGTKMMTIGANSSNETFASNIADNFSNIVAKVKENLASPEAEIEEILRTAQSDFDAEYQKTQIAAKAARKLEALAEREKKLAEERAALEKAFGELKPKLVS